MSEGSITYQDEGEPCGITTVINSELRNHRVCNDGLACIVSDLTNDITGKVCQSVEVLMGERCTPTYDMCYGGLQCLVNIHGDFTCGGETIWGGNPDYVTTGELKASEFKINIILVTIGAIMVLTSVLIVLYELFIAHNNMIGGTIYSKLFNRK